MTLTSLIFHREKLEKQATTHPSGESSSLATASMMAFDNALADTDCYTLMVIDFLKTLGVEVEDA